METWKEIKGYSSRYGTPYFVSSEGRIKNWAGKILSFHKHRKGYQMVELRKEGKGIRKQVHRLVGISFIPNPNKLPQINHKDGIKTNNHISNLEWCTNDYNMAHAIANGLRPEIKKGEDHPQALLTNEQANEIRSVQLNKNGRGNKITRKSLCEKYGVSIHVIKDIRHGKSYNI